MYLIICKKCIMQKLNAPIKAFRLLIKKTLFSKKPHVKTAQPRETITKYTIAQLIENQFDLLFHNYP